MNKLKSLWSNLRESFWFLPSLIVAFSIVVALSLIQVDSSGGQDWMVDWPLLFRADPVGARGMLATIAGSMMTVVGVTFSMTLVTLALASSQYTSRILRNFMSDHATQVVLGIFAGIFTYCLIVLRTIRGDGEGGFVPSLSVTFSVVLAIGGGCSGNRRNTSPKWPNAVSSPRTTRPGLRGGWHRCAKHCNAPPDRSMPRLLSDRVLAFG